VISPNGTNRVPGDLHNYLRNSPVSVSRVRSLIQRLLVFLPTLILLVLFILSVPAREVCAQGASNLTIFGDLKVDESKVSGIKPLSFDVILYNQGGMRLSPTFAVQGVQNQ